MDAVYEFTFDRGPGSTPESARVIRVYTGMISLPTPYNIAANVTSLACVVLETQNLKDLRLIDYRQVD